MDCSFNHYPNFLEVINIMEVKEFENSVGKQVKLVLKNGFYYKCVIDSIEEDCVKVTDFHGAKIFLTMSEIIVLEVTA